MATIDHDRKRISAILLLYGPPGSGKTTSLYALSRILPPGTHGKVAPLVQGDGRLLRLDYRPHDQELVYGYQVNFRLVTCTGPIDVDLIRPLLGAVDAVLVVADSSPGALPANTKSLELLDRMCRGAQRALTEIPTVFMYNKRDLRDAVDIRSLESQLNRGGANYIAASAVRGQGVLEALLRLTASVAVDLRGRMQGHGSEGSGSAGNAKTVAHGTTFPAAQEFQAGNDDVTSVSASEHRAEPPRAEWDVDADDLTDVNPNGWGEQWADAPENETAFSPDRRRGAPQPSRAAFRRREPEPTPELPPAPSSAFRSSEPRHSTSSWRTPEAFHDGVDADDRTMPGSEVSGLFAEVENYDRNDALQYDTGRGPRARDTYRRAPQSRPSNPASSGRRTAGSLRTEPNRTRPNPERHGGHSAARTVGTGRARRMERGETARGPAPTAPPPSAPATAQPGMVTNQTQVLNALGRAPETWEVSVLESGHPMRVPVADLAGYVVSRIGTPTASSRRTVRLPVRATHMDTLVPQDFVLEIDFRGGVRTGSSPPVSARRRPVDDGRQVPLSWIFTGFGVLIAISLMLFFIFQMMGT